MAGPALAWVAIGAAGREAAKKYGALIARKMFPKLFKKTGVPKQTRIDNARKRTQADDAAFAKHKKTSEKKLEDKRRARELARQKAFQQKIKTLKSAGKVEKKDFVVERRQGKINAVLTSDNVSGRAGIEAHRKMDNYEKVQKFRSKASDN